MDNMMWEGFDNHNTSRIKLRRWISPNVYQDQESFAIRIKGVKCGEPDLVNYAILFLDPFFQANPKKANTPFFYWESFDSSFDENPLSKSFM